MNKRGSIIVEMKTGMGKTILGLSLTYGLKLKTLIVVHS